MATVISGDTGVSQVQDNIITSAKIVNGAVTPADTQVGALPSMVRLNTANGYGSTNTKIRRFTNTVTNQGSDITYADSATLGASFTINTNGVYAISSTDTFSSAANIGLSLNTSSPALNIPTIAAPEILAVSTSGGVNYTSSVSWIGYLPAGSVIRAHCDGVAVGANTQDVQFTITRVA